ncbi:DUF4232 domain-containing protein [Streptomyces sp. LX-29]|uniref:DUF4232 domain-containing protein n=1 Tax=Streptomyces sp. LX-29 TaxID=2900152 RepID=UPI00240E118D|nr:DUF4232 domain-containing protein [Streptomyces sp. LX-29]WFB05710.1 DUF4232 domain-containing protein [Streptomyces sp. LX-29]
MRKNRIRTTALAAMTVAAVLSLSACEDGTDSADASSSPSAAQSADKGQKTDGGSGGHAEGSGSKNTPTGAEGGSSTGGGASGNSGGATGDNGGATGDSGGGDKSGYGQVCGTNDLTWGATSESQAGGYILISVKAKPGVTCMLPAALPVVAFGSDGTEAGPAEQAVGEEVKLSGATTAYAGVNPKTTNTDDGKELNQIIVAVSRDDQTDPVSLNTGSITVDKPIVTNWHTRPQDAVPGDGVDGH